MSALDSGMDVFGSPFSPLTHSLIRGNMPNAMGMGMPQAGAPQAGPFTAAHNYARRRGSPTMGQQPAGGGNGPLTNSLIGEAMLEAAGVDDDTKNKLKNSSPQEIQQYLSVRHQFGQPQTKQPAQPLISTEQQQAPAQPTIGGPTPAGVAPGSMQVLQGHGKNAMAAEDLARWQQNIQGKLGAGESLDVNGIGAGPAQQRQPGTTYRELTGTPGFTVGGMTPPPQPQVPQNPLVSAIHQHIQQFPNSRVMQMAQTPGFTPQQIIQQMDREAAEGRQNARQQETEKRQDQRFAHQDQQHHQDQMLRQLQHQQMTAAQQGDDATVQALQHQINNIIQPQQPQPQHPAPTQTQPQQPTQHIQIAGDEDYNQLPSGTTFVGPDGIARRKP